MACRFGSSLPQVFASAGDIRPGDVLEVARAAEAGGLDSLWTQSQTIAAGSSSVLDPLTLLAYAASCTERIELGISVIVAGDHEPIQLAKQLASLDQLSAGRLLVGLGMGAPALKNAIQRATGAKPVRTLLDTVAILKILWAEGKGTFESSDITFEGIEILPKPYRQPHPPIWVNGSHPNSLRRAVKYGTGWMAGGAKTTEEFAGSVEQLSELLGELAVPRADFTIGKRLYVAIDTQGQRAEQRVAQRFGSYSGSSVDYQKVCAYGPPEQVAEAVSAVIEAGADLVVLNPVYDYVEQQYELNSLLSEYFGVVGTKSPSWRSL